MDYTLLFLLMFPSSYVGKIDPKYKGAVSTVQDMAFDRSEIKKLGEQIGNKTTSTYPKVSWAIGAGYALGVKKEVEFKSRKITPFVNTSSYYKYNFEKNSGTVGLSVPF